VASKKTRAQQGAITPRIIYAGLSEAQVQVLEWMIQALGDGSPAVQHLDKPKVEEAFRLMHSPIALCASPCNEDNGVPGPAAPVPAPKAPAKKTPKTPVDKPKSPPRKKK
jgi:hypothetical protein